MSKYIDGTLTVYFDNSNGNLTVPGTLAIGLMSTGTSQTRIVSTLVVNTSTILANNTQSVTVNSQSTIANSIAGNTISSGVFRSGTAFAGFMSTPTIGVSSITTNGRLQISSIRNDETLATGFLHYNPSTSEVVYNSVGGGGGGGGGVIVSASTLIGTNSVIAPTEFFAQELYTTTAFDVTQYGQSFFPGSQSLYYVGIATSASGQYILACDNGNNSTGYLWLSSNFGSSFQQVGSQQSWARVAMNATGQIQMAAIGGPANGKLYQSTDYGQTWALLSGSPITFCTKLAVSASGQYMSIADNTSGFLTNGNIYTSSNFGISWTLNTTAPTIVWKSIAMSASGQYQTACAYGGSIWRSTDYGQNWATTGVANNSYYDVSMSASGQYQTVAAIGGTGNLYVSLDYGVTWTTRGTLGTAYAGVAMSASGQYQMSFVNGGSVYQSTDYGNTWTTNSAPSKSWYDIAMSAAGNITAMAANNPSNLYINSLSQFLPSPQQSLNPLLTEEFTVAVGTNGGTNSWIAYSHDGQNWIRNDAASNLFSSFCFGVAWNGILWIATGYGTNSLATSPDGINWTANSSALTQAVYIRSVAWNGSMWVAVGVSNPNQCIIYSYDGLTWYPSNNGTAIFGSTCFALAWNGVLWVAGGASGSQGIVGYSYDGINWNQSSSATGLLPAGTLTGLIWGGGLWITGCGNVIIRSSDGINWTVSNNALFSGGNVGGFAYNGVIYIATGSYSGGGMIATSPDGITWTANSTLNPLITGYGGAAVWNGSLWIVTGASSTNAGVVITSPDGINWTVNQNASNILIQSAIGIANRKISETAIKQVSTFSNLAITPNVVGSAPSNFMKNYITSGSSLEYGAVAISADGKYQLAGTYTGSGGNLYVSSNYGVSFTAVLTGVGTWYDAAMSDAGNIMYATNNVGGVAGVYISINYGQTWTLIPGLSTNYWSGISCSASGQYVLASSQFQNYLSSDYGSTWTAVGPTGGAGTAVSATGQYMVITSDTGAYVSRNYGATFVTTSINAIGLAISGTGQYILLGYDPNSLYLSSDYGATFTRVGILSAANYYIKCSIDYTGQYQVVTILDIGVYYSNDYGRTWTSVPILAVPQARTAAVSANAQYVISALRNGYIYVFNNPVPVPSLLATTVTQTNQLLVNSATVTGNITALSAYVNSLTTQNISSVTARVSSLYVSSILNSGSFFVSSLRNDAALTTGTVHYNSTTKELVFNESGGAQSTISTYQNMFTSSLGINCNSPQYILDVNGIGNFRSTLSPFAYFSTANVSTANISTAFISSAQLVNLGVSSINTSSIVGTNFSTLSAQINALTTSSIRTSSILGTNLSTVSGQINALTTSSITTSSILGTNLSTVSGQINALTTSSITTSSILGTNLSTVSGQINALTTSSIVGNNISTLNAQVNALTTSSITAYSIAPVIATISTANMSTANISTAFISTGTAGTMGVGTLASASITPVNYSWQTTTTSDAFSTAVTSAFNQQGSNFTLECYFYPTFLGTFNTVLSVNNGSPFAPEGREFRIYYNGSNGFGAGYPSAITTTGYTTGSAIALNAWYHLALVRNATNITLYLNGSNWASATMYNYTTSENRRIQVFAPLGLQNGQGNINSIRFTIGQALYTGTFTPPTQQLTTTSVGTSGANVAASITGSVAFLGAVTNSFTDQSSNALPITITGSPIISISSPTSFIPSLGITGIINIITANISTANISTANISTANISTAQVRGLGVSSLTTSSILTNNISSITSQASTYTANAVIVGPQQSPSAFYNNITGAGLDLWSPSIFASTSMKVFVGAAAANYIDMTQYVGACNASANLYFRSISSGVYTFPLTLSTFRVGVNCNAPQYTLDVNGSINASTVRGAAGVYSNATLLTSDRRIKEFITDANLDICYSNVKQLALRRYKYISTFRTTKYDGTQIGFIADEVSTIFPKSVVNFDVDVDPNFSSIQHMSYDQVFLSHYGATQKLMTVVEDQAAKLAQQSTQMAQLLADNSTLTSMCSYIPQLMNTVSTLKG